MSLLGTQVFANPSTPCWYPANDPAIVGPTGPAGPTGPGGSAFPVVFGTMSSAANGNTNNVITFGSGLAGNVLVPNFVYQLNYTANLSNATDDTSKTILNVLGGNNATNSVGISAYVPVFSNGYSPISLSGIIAHTDVSNQPLDGVFYTDISLTGVSYSGVSLQRIA